MLDLPDFGDDKDILALDDAVFDGARKTLPDFGFVAVAVGAVQKTVAGFQRMVDAFSYDAGRGLPCA